MAWLYLLVAGAFEVVWATTLKLSHGFSNMTWSIFTIFGMIVSFGFLSLALKNIQLSVAYPIWTGIGVIGSIFVGLFLFQDKINGITWLFVALLVIGIVGIKMTSH